jgi:chemotaxis response regulator CheB
MRIGIVNDMRAACEALRRVVDSLPDHEIAWTANDGVEAIAMAKRDRPDLILMDLLMPHVDGAQATRQIMSSAPCAILIVTATVSGNISLVYDAMGYGALDAVDTPMLGLAGEVSGAGALVEMMYHLQLNAGTGTELNYLGLQLERCENKNHKGQGLQLLAHIVQKEKRPSNILADTKTASGFAQFQM